MGFCSSGSESEFVTEVDGTRSLFNGGESGMEDGIYIGRVERKCPWSWGSNYV